jgi:hypothetical protein
MSSSPHNTPVDPQSLNEARAMWLNFTKAGTYTIIGIAVLLLLMAVTLV